MLTLIVDGQRQAVGGCLVSRWAALGLGGGTQSGQVKASQDPSWYRCMAAFRDETRLQNGVRLIIS